MTFLTSPSVTPAADQPGRWRLLEPLVYRDALHGLITVKIGASTDGASIPRLLWSLVGSPMIDSRIFRAAVIHDQLYCTLGAGGQLSRASCDGIFKRALIAAGTPAYRSALYWSGVRIGGWVGWRRYARDPAQVAREQALIAVSRDGR